MLELLIFSLALVSVIKNNSLYCILSYLHSAIAIIWRFNAIDTISYVSSKAEGQPYLPVLCMYININNQNSS